MGHIAGAVVRVVTKAAATTGSQCLHLLVPACGRWTPLKRSQSDIAWADAHEDFKDWSLPAFDKLDS